MSYVTMVTTVAAGYLRFAPDDEGPLLPVFLQGGGSGVAPG